MGSERAEDSSRLQRRCRLLTFLFSVQERCVVVTLNCTLLPAQEDGKLNTKPHRTPPRFCTIFTPLLPPRTPLLQLTPQPVILPP